MAKKVGDAFVDLYAKDDKLKTGLKQSKGMTKAWAAGAKKMAGIAAAAFAAVAGARGIGKMIGAAMRGQEELAKLRAVVRATGGAAGFSASEMAKMAAELQNTSTFGDDAIMSTQSVLATFKNIKGDQFKEATTAILDMSTVLGQDAKQGAIQLGKALNDPIKGVTALQRVGVSFTDSQKEQIKTLQEAGDIMGAQGVILKELRGEFGGAAAEAADTLGGRWKQLKNIFSDTMEVLGLALADIFDLKSVFEKTGEGVASFTEKLKEMREAGVFIKWSERIKAVMKSVGVVFSTSPKKWAEELEKVEKERIANTERRMADLKKEEKVNSEVTDEVVAGEKEKQEEIKNTTGVMGSAADIWKEFQGKAGEDPEARPGGRNIAVPDVVPGGFGGGGQDPEKVIQEGMDKSIMNAKMLQQLTRIAENTKDSAVLA